MSFNRRVFTSTRTALESGWGWLARAPEASRLSEKLARTARSEAEPSRARKRWFCARSWTCPLTFLKYTTWRAPMRPAITMRSPTPLVRTVEK
jgi:hypothetical protein